MGRQESLAALALGRGQYEDEVLQPHPSDLPGREGTRVQQYNDRGYPRNPETKRRERDNVRAANEVMLVTGVVEDSVAAKEKADQSLAEKMNETLLGMRLMDACRTAFMGGTWGTVGLRRRILLYRPYNSLGIFAILRRERYQSSLTRIAFAGLPSQLGDIGSVCLAAVALMITTDEVSTLRNHGIFDSVTGILVRYGWRYVAFHFRMFAILQQLGLAPTSRNLPTLKSFVLFSSESPFQIPPNPSMSLSWFTSFCWVAAPFAVTFLYERLHSHICQILYRPIYKFMPRPTGDIMSDGSGMELDLSTTPDLDTRPSTARRGSAMPDDAVRGAIEGRPVSTEGTGQRQERGESSEDEDEELAHATLISFDVEPTEGTESTAGPWSAELRSANEPKPSDGVKYRVTGLTMLPAIMATEGLRNVAADFIAMPLEAIMVRVLAHTYRESAGLGLGDLYQIGPGLTGWGNLLGVVSMEMVITGAVWAGFAAVSQVWLARNSWRADVLRFTSYPRRWWALMIWRWEMLVT